MPHDDDDEVSLSLSPSVCHCHYFFLRIFHARITNTAKNSAAIKTREWSAAERSGLVVWARGGFKIVIPSRQFHQNEVAARRCAAYISLDHEMTTRQSGTGSLSLSCSFCGGVG